MTLFALEQRLRRIEKARNANRFANLSEDELQAMIDQDLAFLCQGYPSVNALADDLRDSSDPLEREVAGHLDWYIAQWIEEHRETVQ